MAAAEAAEESYFACRAADRLCAKRHFSPPWDDLKTLIVPWSCGGVRVLNMSDEVARDWLRGGCHCKAVRFECANPAAAPGGLAEQRGGRRRLRVWRCNCTVCAMRRNDHFMVPAARFRLLRPEGGLEAVGSDGRRVLSEYRFGTRTARHLFCATCGVTAFYVPRSNPEGFGVSVHCLDRGELSMEDDVEVCSFDGRNWEQSHAATGIATETKVG